MSSSLHAPGSKVGGVKTPKPVSPLRSVALPSEHGGWSLTAEPALLGLIVAWSWSGLAIGIGAVLAFTARTPVKVVLVDRWRGRWLARTTLAAKVAALELFVLGTLGFVALSLGSGLFWLPLLLALPLLLVELYYDMRSKGRHLVPELSGAVGIGAVATAIALAGNADPKIAWGLWIVMAARSVSAIPYVRTQIARAKDRRKTTALSDSVQLVAVGFVALGWLSELVPFSALITVGVFCLVNLGAVRLSPKPAVVIGIQQTFVGLTIIIATAVGAQLI